MVQAVLYTALPIVTTLFLWLTGTRSANFAQAFLTLLLLQAAWGSWLSWKSRPAQEKDFPLFAAVAAMYWLAFGLPLFWSGDAMWGSTITTEGTTRALALAVLGVASLYCGMRLNLWQRLRQASTLDLKDAPISPKYVAGVMLAGTAIGYSPSLTHAFGFGIRQIFMIAAHTLPLVAYAILLRRQLLRPVSLFERVLLILFIVVTIGLGLATGWLGTGAAVLMVSGCVLIDTRFQIPKLALILVLAYVFFLQPAKERFRQTYWGSETQSGALDRAVDWLSTSWRGWENTLASSTPGAIRDSVNNSLGRLALLSQTANVMDVTPGIVPYQGSKMYSYLAVTLIPRAIWRNKPTVNEANRFYQVTYGMTAARDLEGVSISVGMLTESYISYGWAGAVGIMMLVGIFLNGVNTILLGRDSSVLMKGIGLGMMPAFIGPEAQMAQFLGGVLQQILLVIVVMLPIIHVGRRRATLGEASPRRVRVVAGGQMGGQSVRPPQVTR